MIGKSDPDILEDIMGRARDLTMGDRSARRRAVSNTGYTAKLMAFATAAAPDLERFKTLLDEVDNSPRALTFREGRALSAARIRYENLTGEKVTRPCDRWPGIE